jgi:hypothetical protein
MTSDRDQEADVVGVPDPIGKILAAMDGRGAEPNDVPDQLLHEHVTYIV